MERVLRFEVPTKGNKKYVAVLKDGSRVPFGDRRYQHYKDRVPTELGGGRWTRLNHLDDERRKSYRSRAFGQLASNFGTIQRAITIPYSPAWFSFNFLW